MILHVVMVPEDYAVQHVRLRVTSGAHQLADDKIRSRYTRAWPLVVDAIDRSEQTAVYDNQTRHTRVVSRFVDVTPATGPLWPRWTPRPCRRDDPTFVCDSWHCDRPE